MREISTHKVNGVNDALTIEAFDGHNYRLLFGVTKAGYYKGELILDFQNGPVKESDYNGITNEALLAVLIDRLQGFQSGEFKCRENAIALTHLEDAMHWLHHRTRERAARGVEGTSKV